MVSHTGRAADDACPYAVGSLLTLNRACVGNPAGSTGVVYDVYARTSTRRPDGSFTGAWGVGVLFPNGEHDGFSAGEAAQFLEYAGEIADARLAAYRFVDVGRLRHDFQVGVFDRAFGHAVAS